MADYWKSVPKRLCPICDMWMYDNRPSIERHERSAKHKENLEKKIERAMQSKGKAKIFPGSEAPSSNEDAFNGQPSYLTNNAFSVQNEDGESKSPGLSIRAGKSKKVNDFGNNSLSRTAPTNVIGLAPVAKTVREPELVKSHPILGQWETVRLVPTSSSKASPPTPSLTEKSPPVVDQFQLRITANAGHLSGDNPTTGFKKTSRRRPASIRTSTATGQPPPPSNTQ